MFKVVNNFIINILTHSKVFEVKDKILLLNHKHLNHEHAHILAPRDSPRNPLKECLQYSSEYNNRDSPSTQSRIPFTNISYSKMAVSFNKSQSILIPPLAGQTIMHIHYTTTAESLRSRHFRRDWPQQPYTLLRG